MYRTTDLKRGERIIRYKKMFATRVGRGASINEESLMNKTNTRYCISKTELKKIQDIEVEMLQEIDRICKKCDIMYCISAGTQLGAVRHHGFIPWDDDADVAFLRPEYEKFVVACNTELDNSRFYFQDYRNTPGYRWGYGKLRRKGTKFIRLNQEHMPYEQGIFVDIMPYDNVPDNYVLRKIHSGICFFFRKCFWAPLGKEQESGIKRYVYIVLDKCANVRIYKYYEKFISMCNRKETKRIRILSFPVPGNEHGYLRKWFTSLISYKFENLVLEGMMDYDAYLTYKYGNYFELPPLEERKTHPVSKLEF